MIALGKPAPVSRGRVLELEALSLLIIPTLAAIGLLHLFGQDFSIPFSYDNGDPIWQLSLTKAMLDNGWILTNPYLGAPGIAQVYNNSAAQTSAIHSVLMWCFGQFTGSAVAAQQYYYVANFSMITATSYVACRLLGIRRVFAFCVGIAFAFIPYRFTMIPYAFLPNFFMVPLAILLPIWIMTGRLAFLPGDSSLSRFAMALPIAAVAAVSDGYYAFFTLLLMGFATGLRVLCGDIRRPQSLAAPIVLMGVLAGVALLLAQPLKTYRLSHPEEFAPGGIPDSTLFNKPFEADVYSSSLKLMLAPSSLHRVPILASIGEKIVDSSNQARKFPDAQWSPLGMLGGSLFMGLLAMTAMTLLRGRAVPFAGETEDGATPKQVGISTVGAIGALGLFAFICSIFGGIGSLIAFAYPTIRAYDRFPIFLSFLLYCGAALMLTMAVRRLSPRQAGFAGLAVVVVTGMALLDQVPADILALHRKESRHFVAERKFVAAMEAALPPGAMVYQYPHSQYLSDSRYYGWGSFRHIRLYLNSHALRWSNGAAKNSPVDNWHARIADLPASQLVTEAQAAGFRAVVVDRSVVTGSEYQTLHDVLTARTGREPMGDDDGQLAFWPLPDPGYRLDYETDFRQPRRLTITDAAQLPGAPMSRLVDRNALLQAVAAGTSAVIERSANPAIFRDGRLADLGLGLGPIKPGELQGDVTCPPQGRPLSVSRDSLTMTVSNRSRFDWQINSGPAPLRIGMMKLLGADGAQLRWDGGFRVADRVYIPQGGSVQLHIPLAALDPGPEQAVAPATAVFALLQEGNMWFAAEQGNGECRVAVVR